MAENVKPDFFGADWKPKEWKPAPEGQYFDPQPADRMAQQLVITNRTDLTVRAVGQTCTTNDCPPRGNAVCVLIEVKVPLAANILAVRFYSNAAAPDDLPVPVFMPIGDRAWSYYDGWGERSDGSSVTKSVYGSYHNRSDNRPRHIALEVDFT